MSNTSILGKKRNASAASSKRSATRPEGSTENLGEANARAAQTAQMPKQKKSRGFLSFLNCCGVPDNANGVDSEEVPLPAKQVTAASAHNRPITSSKPAASEPKNSQKQSEATRSAMKSDSEHNGSFEKNGGLTDATDEIQSEKAPASEDQSADLTPQTQSGNPQSGKPSIALETQTRSNPSVVVEAPTPVILPNSNSTNSTPQIGDSNDDSVPDAETGKAVLPHAPELQDTEMGGTQVTYTVLPLPPPLTQNDPQAGGSAQSDEVVMQDAHEEKQQWLLPPIEPRFKGKKCLVLDLDETLVHSSFKVR